MFCDAYYLIHQNTHVSCFRKTNYKLLDHNQLREFLSFPKMKKGILSDLDYEYFEENILALIMLSILVLLLLCLCTCIILVLKRICAESYSKR